MRLLVKLIRLVVFGLGLGESNRVYCKLIQIIVLSFVVYFGWTS